MARTSYGRVKRTIDVVGSAALLVLTAPVQVVVALLVRRNLGTPVLFRQQRPGKDEVLFDLVKFRSMVAPEPSTGLQSDEQRLTPFGSWLRSTSLDELPTLWNVLRGDMSLVGPRPLLVQYLPRYDDDQRRRHDVRPGMTGLAQVNGRNAIDWPRKLALDVQYVQTRSIRLDVSILVRTVLGVLRRDGITDEAGISSGFFVGSSETASRTAVGAR